MQRRILLTILLSTWLIGCGTDNDTSTANTPLDGGIDCTTLLEWSTPIEGYHVNQHHVFCGEPARKNNAKGFHATPENRPPSSYRSAINDSSPNRAGIYTLKRVRLEFNGTEYTKSFSSMFPTHCSQAQINNSIVYAQINNRGNCASPGWAKCGPNAPTTDDLRYCQGNNGNTFEIASALLPNDTHKINTGFPIYTP